MDRYELELTYYEVGNLKFKLLESNIEYSIKRQTHDFICIDIYATEQQMECIYDNLLLLY